MGQWAKSSPTHHFIELWQSAKAYYERGPTGTRPALNFEKVLGDMIAMAHWMEPPPWGDALRQAACNGAPPPTMKFRQHKEPEEEVADAPLLPARLICNEGGIRSDECEAVGAVPVEANSPSDFDLTANHPQDDSRGRFSAYIELTNEYRFLLEKLAQHLRKESKAPGSAKTLERGKYNDLFRVLRANFDIGVYNLNYDTAALNVLPDAYTGFSDAGRFEPRAVHERQDWDFVYHLHGCEGELQKLASLPPEGFLDNPLIASYRSIIPQVDAAISADMQTAASGQASLKGIADRVAKVYESGR